MRFGGITYRLFVKKVCMAGIVLVVLCISVFFFSVFSGSVTSIPLDIVPADAASLPHLIPTEKRKNAVSREYDPLQYIPTNTVSMWREHDFAVVFGIPSEDSEARRRRRNLQRETCWQYDGVATRSNGYNGSMLVLYVLGRNPEHQYVYTPETLREAGEWHDIVALDVNEGKKTQFKRIGEGGGWGFEAHVGNSRKVFMWFDLVLRTFPRARYVGKGDDDMFLRVPQYLSDLQRLPPRGSYWGYLGRHYYGNNKNILFISGPCVSLERSAAEAFVSYAPIRRLCLPTYKAELRREYDKYFMFAEDVMVGFVLNNSFYTDLVYVSDNCRYQDCPSRFEGTHFDKDWIMVHHIREEHYTQMMQFYANVPVATVEPIKKGENKFYLFCPAN